MPNPRQPAQSTARPATPDTRTAPRRLVLIDGGLPSLVSLRIAAMEFERSRRTSAVEALGPVACLMPWDGGALHTRRARAAVVGARVCGVQQIEPVGDTNAAGWPGAAILSGGAGSGRGGESVGGGGAGESQLLLKAQECARAEGCSALVWPVQVSPDGTGALDRIAAILDRALLLSQLSVVDGDEAGGLPGVEIRTPLVDLRDEQVVELALDLDLPLRAMTRGDVEPACWWCERGADGPSARPMGCGECPACERWFSAWRKVDGLSPQPAVQGQSVAQVVVGKTGFTTAAQRTGLER